MEAMFFFTTNNKKKTGKNTQRTINLAKKSGYEKDIMGEGGFIFFFSHDNFFHHFLVGVKVDVPMTFEDLDLPQPLPIRRRFLLVIGESWAD